MFSFKPLNCPTWGGFKSNIWLLNLFPKTDHNIIEIHNNVMWDWQYSMEYFHLQYEYWEYYVKYC